MDKRVSIALIAAFIISGCGGEKETNRLEEINKTAQSVIADVAEQTSKIVEYAGEISQKVDEVAQSVNKTIEVTQTALQEAANISIEALQKANETITNAAIAADKIIDESVKPALDSAKQKADNIAQAAAAPVTNAEKGKKLFTTCVPCHGAKAEKSAVNKSQIINKWSKEQIIAALKGYKDGTYGGAFKATMVPTVKRLSDSDIEELGAYIVNLGKQ
ncbi:MAG: c-type cytochrome [Campylobacteraceae bacterium]|jgi:cytochrome c553|nr:c-type cytochrome [Campylobacteraceae bacterium]